MFYSTSHILGETCECSAPLSTYWHRHANIMHLSAHIRKSMPIYCTTWHIFTGLSEYIRRSIPMFCYYWHGILPSISLLVARAVKCRALPLSTSNDAGCINTLKCPTLIEPSRVPLRRSCAEVCRWSTSLAGSSLCRGSPYTNYFRLARRGPMYTALPSPQTATKMVRNLRPRRSTIHVRHCPSVRRHV